MFSQIVANHAFGVFLYLRKYPGIIVVHQRHHVYAFCPAHLQAHHRVVYASKFRRCHEYRRQFLPGQPVREVNFPVQRHAKAANPFAQYVLILPSQGAVSRSYLRRVYLRTVYLGGQVGGTRHRKQERACKPFPVLRKKSSTHKPAVSFYVLRYFTASGLGYLLRYHAFPGIEKITGKYPCNPCLAGIGIYTCYEISFIFHRSDVFSRLCSVFFHFSVLFPADPAVAGYKIL